MSDRMLDPITADFVSAPGGAFLACDDDVENMVAMSYLNARGSWEGDPGLGHRFAELDDATNTSQNRLRLRDLAVDAVQWLIDAKLIKNVVATVESIGADGVAFEVDYVSVNSGAKKSTGRLFVSVGGE